MYQIKVNDHINYEVRRIDDTLLVNGEEVSVDIKAPGSGSWNVLSNFESYNAEVISFDKAAKTASIKINNNVYTVNAKDQFDMLLAEMGLSNLNISPVSDVRAPMPGLVLKLFVKEGLEVKKGDNLFILEAMKMENIIKSPADAVIKQINIKPGDKVEKGQVLLCL